MAEANPRVTKYIYLISSKVKTAVRFSDLSRAEEVVARTFSKDKEIIELCITLFIGCILVFIFYRIALKLKRRGKGLLM